MITLVPIGHVRSSRTEPVDDDWDGIESWVHLDPEQFGPEALAGLDSFSHVEVIFQFHAVRPEAENRGARHPRGREDWPLVGIFAQRGKDRPNHIGLTTCQILEVDGLILKLQGLDAIDGTPVLDLKPVMAGFQPRGEVIEPEWAAEIMKDYW
jgi:tRNA-Thr(GGU) m(6)t(6)A37 methyltransferase TsaA